MEGLKVLEGELIFLLQVAIFLFLVVQGFVRLHHVVRRAPSLFEPRWKREARQLAALIPDSPEPASRAADSRSPMPASSMMAAPDLPFRFHPRPHSVQACEGRPTGHAPVPPSILPPADPLFASDLDVTTDTERAGQGDAP